MPICRCPRCTHRPLAADAAACPSCGLDLVLARADAAALMRPSRDWCRGAVSSTSVTLTNCSIMNVDAEPEPINGAVRDCPTCGAPFRYTDHRTLAAGVDAAGWFCEACGGRAIERFA